MHKDCTLVTQASWASLIIKSNPSFRPNTSNSPDCFLSFENFLAESKFGWTEICLFDILSVRVCMCAAVKSSGNEHALQSVESSLTQLSERNFATRKHFSSCKKKEFKFLVLLCTPRWLLPVMYCYYHLYLHTYILHQPAVISIKSSSMRDAF
jgi:hypothetical protein